MVENDGNVAAWAEFRFGAARDADDSMVLFTVGTGIGGGIVLGGKLFRGAHGIAGRARAHAWWCPTAGRAAAAGTAASSSTPAATRWSGSPGPARGRSRSRADRGCCELAGGDVEAITGPMVTRAAQAATRSAIGRVRRRSVAGSAVGLADLVQVLDPQVLVVGGGVIDAGELLLGPARAAFEPSARPARAGCRCAEVRAARQMGNSPAWWAPPTWPGAIAGTAPGARLPWCRTTSHSPARTTGAALARWSRGRSRPTW